MAKAPTTRVKSPAPSKPVASAPIAPASVSRTSGGLRDALFDEIDRLRNGQTDHKKANAVARLASEIVNTVQMEIEVHKHTNDGGKVGSNAKRLPLEFSLGAA